MNLVKSLMIDSVKTKLLFTKVERYLLRHQSNPFVLTTHQHQVSDSSDFDIKDVVHNQSLYIDSLLHGVHTTNREEAGELEHR